MANPYRGVVVLRASQPAAGEARSPFPIYDAYAALRTSEEKDAFVRVLMRNLRIESQKLVDEMNAAVPSGDVKALYAWGKENGHDIDHLLPQMIASYQRMETRGAVVADEWIRSGSIDRTARLAGIPIEKLLPPEAGGAAGEPGMGGRRRKTRRRKSTRKHTQRRRHH